MKRLITSCLILLLSLTMITGCQKEKDPAENYAIKVGGLLVSDAEYSRLIQELRAGYLSNTDEEDSKEFWASYVDEDTTLSQFITDFACEQLTNEKLYILQFEKLGLSLTAEEEQALRKSLEAEVTEAGGMSAFQASLAESGYTYEEYEGVAIARLKKEKVIDYYFGAEGKEKKTSEQDIKDWYNVHNAYLHAILFMRIDSATGEKLTDAEQQTSKTNAQTAYDSAVRESVKDYFDEIAGIYSDQSNVQSGNFLVSDSGQTDAITQQALKLKFGEVALVETDNYYAVLKRYDGTADDLFTKELRNKTLETIRSEALDALLAQWNTDFGVTVHQESIDRYTPESFVAKK